MRYLAFTATALDRQSRRERAELDIGPMADAGYCASGKRRRRRAAGSNLGSAGEAMSPGEMSAPCNLVTSNSLLMPVSGVTGQTGTSNILILSIFRWQRFCSAVLSPANPSECLWAIPCLMPRWRPVIAVASISTQIANGLLRFAVAGWSIPNRVPSLCDPVAGTVARRRNQSAKLDQYPLTFDIPRHASRRSAIELSWTSMPILASRVYRYTFSALVGAGARTARVRR